MSTNKMKWKELLVDKIAQLLIVAVIGGIILFFIQEHFKKSQDTIVLKDTITNSQMWGLDPEVDNGNIFNDFNYKDDKLLYKERPVQFLWSDPSGEFRASHHIDDHHYISNEFKPTHQIWTRLLKEQNVLRIGFSNLAWGANVAIRPKNSKPIDISKFNTINIEIRSPKKEYVGFRIRIVDENNIQWIYGKEYINDPAGEVKIQYEDYTDGKNWVRSQLNGLLLAFH